MPDVRLTGVALSMNAFPSVIAEMPRGYHMMLVGPEFLRKTGAAI